MGKTRAGNAPSSSSSSFSIVGWWGRRLLKGEGKGVSFALFVRSLGWRGCRRGEAAFLPPLVLLLLLRFANGRSNRFYGPAHSTFLRSFPSTTRPERTERGERGKFRHKSFFSCLSFLRTRRVQRKDRFIISRGEKSKVKLAFGSHRRCNQLFAAAKDLLLVGFLLRQRQFSDTLCVGPRKAEKRDRQARQSQI